MTLRQRNVYTIVLFIENKQSLSKILESFRIIEDQIKNFSIHLKFSIFAGCKVKCWLQMMVYHVPTCSIKLFKKQNCLSDEF